MKTKIAASIASLALALSLVACGGSTNASVLKQDLLDEASGVRVTAENAQEGNSVSTEDAITVKEGDVLVISPDLTEGSVHLTITSSDGKTVVYDEDVSGRVLFREDIEPGTYSVTTSGNGATGTMTVFANSAEEEAALDASLSEELQKQGVDASAVQDE